MSLILDKAREVLRTLIPVVVLVLVLSFTIIDVDSDVFMRFIIGSLMLLVGLSIFLWGVDLSMNPIGGHMSREVATSRSVIKILVLSFLLGFLITVAEPDLLVLGIQIQTASGGTMNSALIVYLVSAGVGLMVSLGIFWLLKDRPLGLFMAITYVVIFIFTIFVSQEFLAISFDASGATTGALTTPFALAISLGLSQVKGGKRSQENSFGLVGIMSAGPMIAIMPMSIITGQKNIQGTAEVFIATEGILWPILKVLPKVFLESVLALLPITALFFLFNYKKFKLTKDGLAEIIKGLIFTLIGLTLFLAAVNSGFMEMGRIIGMELAKMSPFILVGVAFLMGLIVVLVEPAVLILGEQIQEVTAGHIPVKLIRTTLSIGVGLAIGLSMVRIIVPAVQLWFFIIPGFALAIILSFFADPVFVGIAYDAGGVASGPMTATFVLAFAQGAADMTETANVLVDGFGVIAMVAMAPVLSIMILGTIFRHKKKVERSADESTALMPQLIDQETDPSIKYSCILVIVNRGFAETVVDLARQAGAKGATIIKGRGHDADHKLILPILNVEIQAEKEIIMLITANSKSPNIADSLLNDPKLKQEGDIKVFISPSEAMVETLTAEKTAEIKA